MTNLIKEIQEKISSGELKPEARWKFLLHDYVIWAVGLVSLLIGALSVAVIIYLLGDHDWTLYKMAHENFFFQVLTIVPYFWIIILIIFGAVAYYNVRHTKRGYKFHSYWIILASVGFSLLLGSIIYATGLGAKIDDTLYSHLKPYRQVIMHKADMWQRPGQGRLAGKILEILEDDELLLVTFEGREWLVDVSDAEVHPRVQFEKSRVIMILGEEEDNDHFSASQVMPWAGRDLKDKSFLFKDEMRERKLKRRAY